jgi:2,3,4,5-tetrahydropyridine-2-carboxylate N-succinyltransferase
MTDLQTIIEEAFEHRGELSPGNAPGEVRNAVDQALGLLESGAARVAEKGDNGWVVNQWLKKAVLLSFRLNDNGVIPNGYTQYYDKVPPKYAGWTEAEFRQAGVRVVPPAAARRGSYIAPGVVLMRATSTSEPMWTAAPWWTRGPPWAPAPRLVRTFISPAASASVVYWSPCRPAPPSSRTTASSAPARR